MYTVGDMRHIPWVTCVNGLYAIVGDMMVTFIECKPTPFGKGCLLSKERFWAVPTFKRALVWCFWLRHFMGFKAQRQWKKFTVEDYKVNTRAVAAWTKHEKNIMSQSPKFKKIPDRFEHAHAGRRRRVSLVGTN